MITTIAAVKIIWITNAGKPNFLSKTLNMIVRRKERSTRTKKLAYPLELGRPPLEKDLLIRTAM